MRFLTRFRPSPALVIASVALLVALGGTSVAAVALVPTNSVGSAQVIDGSLQSSDFGAGAVLAGSEKLTRSVDGPVAPKFTDSLSTIASLPVAKAGAYVIWATAQVDSANLGGQCVLIAHGPPGGGGGFPDASVEKSPLESGSSVRFGMAVIHGFGSSGGTIDLQCGGVARGPSQVRKIKITAFRLGS
jgi:hypothetical protein